MKKAVFLYFVVLFWVQLSQSTNLPLQIDRKPSRINDRANLEDEFFSPVKGDPEGSKSKPKTIAVKNHKDLVEKYSDVLDDEKANVIFELKETKTFLARSSGRNNSKDIENIDATGAGSLALPRLRSPFRKGKDKDDDNVEWVEYTYENASQVEYPGYIPISGCHSLEYGAGGSVQFTYSFTDTLTGTNSFETEFGVTYSIFSLTIAMSLAIDLSVTKTIDGSTSCTIPAGYVGQVLLKPIFLSCTPTNRRARWNQRSRRLLLDPKFERHEKVFVLLNEATLQIECATSDVVELFCEGSEMGHVDWENPKGVGYEDKIYRKNSTSFDQLLV